MSKQDVIEGQLEPEYKINNEASLNVLNNILPLHWTKVRLEDVASYINGYAFKPSDWGTIGLPIIRIQNLNDPTKPYNYFAGQIPERYRVREGDILISWSASLGTYMWSGTDAWLNQHIFKALVKENIIYRDYFYWTMTREIKHIAAEQTHGSTMKHVVQSVFLSSKIPLPPHTEQQAIARVLRVVHKAIQARRDELELERELKAALMEYIFTHGMRGEPTKQTEIGEIPENWKIVPLGELLREPLKNGHSARESNTNEGIRTLTLTSVTQNNFSIENTKLTVAEPNKVCNLWLKPGDIFIERANTLEFVGLAALYEGLEDFAIYPDLLIRVRLKVENMIPRFAVEFLFSDNCRIYFRKNASGTAGNMPKIDQGTIAQTLMPFPSIEEQYEIAEVSKACDVKIAALNQEISLLEELFETLLEELMIGQVSTLPLIEKGEIHE